ncbi:MAG: sugar phosphate isomerase/epimerase [Oscillospiraceae bacterium]|nr:sugar phosphate isomerase/epimerase [Oscillospiraceae bacterium]MDD3833145.1 sugar phosphate isomerase/epimerase [Oscillospiraceae bacterium]MDD4414239.1 sugar phosphate isomerase/epimerase [Oscillospiraceae bacterium]
MSQFTLCAFADEAGADINDQIKALNENKIPCLEVRGVGDKSVSQLTIQEAKGLKKQLNDNGIRIWSIGSPLGKIGIKDDFAPHLDLFKHILELAHATEAECIRLFSFYIPSGEDAVIYRDEVMERLSRFCEAAWGSKVSLCHENEKGIFGDIAPRCLEIHQQIPEMHAIFDPANFVQCGQDTFEAWELLAPYVKYMHIKDAKLDGSVVPAGKGDGNIPQILEKYRAQGGNVLTLEPHLSVFSGLEALENGEKSIVNEYDYPSQRVAFDAGVSALKLLI